MEFWATFRDIVIVVWGVLGIIGALAFIVVMLMLLRVVKDIQRRLEPTLDSAQVTANTVQATTRFVGEMVVKPAASVVGAAAAVGKAVQVLSGKDGRPRR